MAPSIPDNRKPAIERTKAYVARRTAEGKAKRDIIRCLKRYVIREVYHLVSNPVTSVDASWQL